MLNDSHDEDVAFGHSVFLVVTFNTADEVKKSFYIFQYCCKIILPMRKTDYRSCFVLIVDEFGVRWELMTDKTGK